MSKIFFAKLIKSKLFTKELASVILFCIDNHKKNLPSSSLKQGKKSTRQIEIFELTAGLVANFIVIQAFENQITLLLLPCKLKVFVTHSLVTKQYFYNTALQFSIIFE